MIPPNMRVLEIGCAEGDLLAAIRPAYGLGIDLSDAMVSRARAKYPSLHFEETDAGDLQIEEAFDYIICSDLINELWDVQSFFRSLLRCSHDQTRILINTHSKLWQLPRRLAESGGIATPQLKQNWLTVEDCINLLYLAGIETIRSTSEIMCPIRVPGLYSFFNKYVVKLWPFRHLAVANFVIARPAPRDKGRDHCYVSVIVPARNEEGNISQLFERIPKMGLGTEIVFVEGNSGDDTYKRIAEEIRARPAMRAKLFKQTGKGKGDAVRLGFAESTGDLLMILDADLTVPPEDLPRFYEAWRSGKADFVNGVRLVYPMQENAMRLLNLIGNRFFRLAFTWLLGQNIKDTLCGTKVLSQRDYTTIAQNRAYFGDSDPFGDFDLLFGAARFNLKIVDMPIRYDERTYGTTNIQRWRHGLILLKMLVLASRKLRFV